MNSKTRPITTPHYICTQKRGVNIKYQLYRVAVNDKAFAALPPSLGCGWRVGKSEKTLACSRFKILSARQALDGIKSHASELI